MLFYGESRRLPSLNGVARGTFASIRTLDELPVVRIGFVAVRALGEWQWLFEVAAGVALRTADAGMLAFQQILRLRVIEALVHRLQRNLPPPAGVMARLASLGSETAVMRILVTVGTLGERNPCVSRLAICAIHVTLGALHLSM